MEVVSRTAANMFLDTSRRAGGLEVTDGCKLAHYPNPRQFKLPYLCTMPISKEAPPICRKHVVGCSVSQRPLGTSHTQRPLFQHLSVRS